jgi:hypothetical protein
VWHLPVKARMLPHTHIMAPQTVHKRFVAPLVRASCAVTA